MLGLGGAGELLCGGGGPITGQGRSLKDRKWWVEEHLMASAGSLCQAGPAPSLCCKP